jgi:hypothetical protein
MTTSDEIREQARALLAQADAIDHGQLSRADLKRMTPEQIVEAKGAGRFDALLGVPQEQLDLINRAKTGQIDHADLRELSRLNRPDLINAAHTEGRITTGDNARASSRPAPSTASTAAPGAATTVRWSTRTPASRLSRNSQTPHWECRPL